MLFAVTEAALANSYSDRTGKFGSKKRSSYSNGGAISNFSKKVVRKKRERSISSPLNAINASRSRPAPTDVNGKKKKYSKKNELQQYYSKDDSAKDAYSDFDKIFKSNKYVGYYKVGRPYKIKGTPYYPQEYDHYSEVGVASWYGEAFDGKLTANGEIYDLSFMTAAHRTLPMPSMVRVTNLENSKSVIVRVNDRGPFAKNRIIDLSKQAAEMLDYKEKGTIMVKVDLLKNETNELHRKLKLRGL